MKIGILYESKEWSNFHLLKLLQGLGFDASLIDLSLTHFNLSQGLSFNLLVNRVFASSWIRGVPHAVSMALEISRLAESSGIRVINSSKAFLAEISKAYTYTELKRMGMNLPNTVVVNNLTEMEKAFSNLEFPMVMKHNRCGRAFQAKKFNSQEEFLQNLENFSVGPDGLVILQEFKKSREGFISRIEVLGGSLMFAIKRYLAEGDISSYSRGSVFEVYSDVPGSIVELSLKAAKALEVEMGGFDIIEGEDEKDYIIDVNSTSNFTPDYIDLLGFDPIEKMALYIAKEAQKLYSP